MRLIQVEWDSFSISSWSLFLFLWLSKSSLFLGSFHLWHTSATRLPNWKSYPTPLLQMSIIWNKEAHICYPTLLTASSFSLLPKWIRIVASYVCLSILPHLLQNRHFACSLIQCSYTPTNIGRINFLHNSFLTVPGQLFSSRQVNNYHNKNI